MSSVTTARKKAATTLRAAFSGRGGSSTTSGSSSSATSTAAGSSTLGSTTTPSGLRADSGSSLTVANFGPESVLRADPHASKRAKATLTLLDGRVIRTGDGDHRTRRDGRPPAGFFVEVGRD